MGPLEVPTAFLPDRHCDAHIAAAWFQSLQAPHKALIWFENSADNAPSEELATLRGDRTEALRAPGVLQTA